MACKWEKGPLAGQIPSGEFVSYFRVQRILVGIFDEEIRKISIDERWQWAREDRYSYQCAMFLESLKINLYSKKSPMI
jgi:hypothetical protein